MTRYALLNGVVLLGVILFVLSNRPSATVRKQMVMTTLGLVILTAIFDPLIIHAGIVAYHHDLTLGITFFGAPIEDFAYALAAGLLVPVLWNRYE